MDMIATTFDNAMFLSRSADFATLTTTSSTQLRAAHTGLFSWIRVAAGRSRTHVRAISQFVPLQRLNEVLLEPGDGPRKLLARGSGGDEGPELRTMRPVNRVHVPERRGPRPPAATATTVRP